MAILVGLIDGGIEASCYVAGVNIAIAEFNQVCICSRGHGARSKILVVYRNSREIGSVNGGGYKNTYPLAGC